MNRFIRRWINNLVYKFMESKLKKIRLKIKNRLCSKRIQKIS